MEVQNLVNIIGADFYTGVPDSQLKALCDYLIYAFGIDPSRHIIAANEGNCTAIAAGYYLATGKIPVVYMQNSGEGNIINPVASLLNDKVYAIPTVFIIGWRGEPGIPDEPQHIHQGKVTIKLLETMDIPHFIIDKETKEEDLEAMMEQFKQVLASGRSVAFIVRKGAISFHEKILYKNEYGIMREDIIRHIVHIAGDDPVISTTGKTSRELFEIRESNGQSHKYDFLTVGSMGHSSSIALGVALNKPDKRIWCIDGDGAALMHMGAMATIGSIKPSNMVHVLINNGAHESVGGMPTVGSKIEFTAIAKGCGYPYAASIEEIDRLDEELHAAKRRDMLSLLEVKCAIGARENLGRPTTTAKENKENFMNYLQSI